MDLEELHRRTVQEWVRRVAGVEQQQWSRPTPCEEWDVRTLVNHVVGEDLWTTPIAEGRTIEEVGDRFDGDVLQDAPVAVATEAAEHAVSAVAQHLPEHREVHLSFADVPIDEYVWQIATDHLIHAWDLAAATGQDRTLDAELVETVTAWFGEREAMYREYGVIGPARDPHGADPQSLLLGRFGRDPQWADASSG